MKNATITVALNMIRNHINDQLTDCIETRDTWCHSNNSTPDKYYSWGRAEITKLESYILLLDGVMEDFGCDEDCDANFWNTRYRKNPKMD
jgi:hypothetical protein